MPLRYHPEDPNIILSGGWDNTAAWIDFFFRGVAMGDEWGLVGGLKSRFSPTIVFLGDLFVMYVWGCSLKMAPKNPRKSGGAGHLHGGFTPLPEV